MAKKVLVITSSMRRGGNSETLADEVARGAAEAGNSVEKIALADYELKFCKGCLACQKTGKCVIKDGTEQILAKMNEADVIAFATPIYYYEMSGQLKTLLDRSNPLFGTDYGFRDIYLFTSAADDSEEADERALVGRPRRGGRRRGRGQRQSCARTRLRDGPRGKITKGSV